MTRIQQWLHRRSKMIRRGVRMWNARPRGDAHHGYGPPTGNPQHAGGWTWGGTEPLLRPVLIPKTLRVQMLAVNHPMLCVRQPGVGRAHPPHYTATFAVHPAFSPTTNYRDAICHTHTRTVKIRKRKASRIRGVGYVSYLAWVYEKQNAAWPPWDPKGRTPVDTQDRWDED